MSQQRFIDRHGETWREFEELLEACEDRHPGRQVEAFPDLYRKVCRHLAVARHRGYSDGLVEKLDARVQRGHAVLYGGRESRWGEVLEYIRGGYARDVRRDWPYLAVAAFVFVVPLVGVFLWVGQQPDWAYHILGAEQIQTMESMYESAPSIRAEREADSDLLMFGFYIYNNIGLALRTFGSGLLFGVGALVTLVYNGTVLGGVAGHIQNAGLGDAFWPFVIGHGAFELTAIVLAGQAGLKLGFAPIWPGRRGRLEALKEAASESVGLVCGFVGMLLAAAFIEAFWSPSTVAADSKYMVGTGLWVVVVIYFTLGGRQRGTG